jgi:hypothetical protein
MRVWSAGAAIWIALTLPCGSSVAWAQYPPPQPPPQPYPAQPYPQPPPQPTAQPYPPQPYPPQQQPLPPPQQYPPQPYPQPAPQPSSPYGQPPPPGYGQQPVWPAPYPPAPVGPTVQPAPPPQSRYRTPGEMAYLYGVGLAYGLGTGIWIDALGKVSDPGIAFIAPALLAAGVPLGIYAWDQADEMSRGVPSSIGTGLLLGGIEGIAIDGLQWQATGNNGPDTWSFRTWTTVTFVAATAGGVGGYAFGEWLQPDPRSLGLIASAAGWGSIAGVLFGSGVASGDWKDGAAVWGFAGYNAGIVAAGAFSVAYVPSWQTIKYMWLGDLLGTLATTPVYFFYIGSDADPRHGLIANAVGGLAGLGIAGLLTANMTDGPETASWKAPFQLAVSPTSHGGAQLTAYGQF